MIARLKIDVSKIKKEHIFEGQKGKYINVDVFIDNEPDQFGNMGGVKQSFKINERYESVYIGNVTRVIDK